jgi:hypothetical protein
MDDKVRFTIKLSASSNISYRNTIDCEVDREDWDDMTPDQRRKEIDTQIEEAVWNDINGHVEFEDDADNPDA